MRIWELWNNEDNLGLVTIGEEFPAILDEIDGRSLVDSWTPIPVEIEGGKRKKKDFAVFLLKAPVVSGKTKALLEPFLRDQVEFLPLDYQPSDPKDNTTFYICNVLNIVNCIDEEKSSRKYSKRGTFIDYDKIIFNERIFDIESELKIFKVSDISNKICFATDQFKEFLESHSISGPNFKLIWDSEVDYEQVELAYNETILSINKDPQLILSWSEAVERLEQGKSLISDRWKIRYDANQNLLLGSLNDDLTYDFVEPLYIPPILLDLKWKEIAT
ncbi:hypothetical protein SK066_17980 [Paenibacillus hunanensis]|uniref:imm11 family protein n=1 Tax=Paenibacillus hunanensis TaxID=539262 RepID=UPI002A6A9C4A|nr:DUF1629 domain-containing protein [Paenibacillus hunanensis]WPP40472.1 hypothetical protein SK066_17980 [Paenibacillus hunanensis]